MTAYDTPINATIFIAACTYAATYAAAAYAVDGEAAAAIADAAYAAVVDAHATIYAYSPEETDTAETLGAASTPAVLAQHQGHLTP